jgi:release factor glutamine methyltransferase
MRSRIKKAFFGNYVFDVWENVYEPAEDSFLFAEHLRVNEGARVLDMGTGCGILGILTARKAIEVVAVDVNPYAVRCARHNAAVNGLNDKMAFVRADLLTFLVEDESFDLILFNAPYLPTENDEADTWLSRAWAGGATGRQVIDRFISQAPRHLKRDGQILLMQSTLADVEKTQLGLAECGLRVEVAARLFLPFFEELILLRAKHSA